MKALHPIGFSAAVLVVTMQPSPMTGQSCTMVCCPSRPDLELPIRHSRSSAAREFTPHLPHSLTFSISSCYLPRAWPFSHTWVMSSGVRRKPVGLREGLQYLSHHPYCNERTYSKPGGIDLPCSTGSGFVPLERVRSLLLVAVILMAVLSCALAQQSSVLGFVT